MSVRTEFVSWLRQHRHKLVSGEFAVEALSALGLDDDGLDTMAHSASVVITLPHASPNVFFPRVRVGWYARHLQRQSPELLHLRIVLTHVNFSDLGWRPYAWWHLDAEGQLWRSTFFSRNKKHKHVVVSSRPPLGEVAEPLHGADVTAARLARAGANLAVSYLLVMATVERAAGLAPAGRTIYVPLSLLTHFAAADISANEGDDARWLRRLVGAAPGRRVDESGLLTGVADVRDAEVFDNATNIALLASLGDPAVLGGAKMARYWPQVLGRWQESTANNCQVPPPRLATVPADVDCEAFLPPGSALAAQLAAAGVGYSQGMALSQHGPFAARTDPFASARPGPAG